MEYLPVPGTLPDGWCPATWQTVLNKFASLLPITINGEDEVIIQADDPGPDDRSKVWIKTLDVAPWVDSIRIWVPEIPPDGDWRPIPGQPVYFLDTGAADAMVIATGEAMNTEAFLTGRIFLVKANNTNTGSVTLAVDSVTAKAVKKQNNVDMEAGDFVAGQILLLAFDPVSNVFEVVNTLAPEPVVLPPQTPDIVVSMTPYTIDNSAGYGVLPYTFAHGLPGTPTYVRGVVLLGSTEADMSGFGKRYNPGVPGVDFITEPAFTLFASNTDITVAFSGSTGTYPAIYRNTSGTISSLPQFGPFPNFKVYAEYVSPRSITVTTQPSSLTKSAGQNATFTVVASGDTPITYQWQRNGVNIFDGGRLSGTATAALTITGVVDGVPPGGDEANYSCVLTNGVGSVSSNTASLTVT